MSVTQVVVNGTLKADGTLELDEKPNLPPGPVEVVVQAKAPPASEQEDLMTVLERIWQGQKERGHVPRTREEIDADIDALRDEWEQRLAKLDRIREEPQNARERPSC